MIYSQPARKRGSFISFGYLTKKRELTLRRNECVDGGGRACRDGGEQRIGRSNKSTKKSPTSSREWFSRDIKKGKQTRLVVDGCGSRFLPRLPKEDLGSGFGGLEGNVLTEKEKKRCR